ncbi:aminoglycoside 6'-N-acetyltransferase [Sagittula stellata]|uniref:Aminoglycoside N(6')-acetyltransferase type 1 n=1 Tax=Sagittula stellata (strain ATCC 700073 / DSM 11524 / E-37) TaxID=388399 RepID=A3K9E2_SAGS3|nr:aminoglycoside 6'-N-acetyltransferase [Sagittula stellata]EBA06314.1 aminoglycoside acetyltransferase (6') type I [Sagittula stellata E-37]
MSVRTATESDLEAWVALRLLLWPDTSPDTHRAEAAAVLAAPEATAFLEKAEDGSMRAFAEAALRHDHVNGCETSPVAFLEGIFVRAEDRGRGHGARLLAAVRDWARGRGCAELASDAHLSNVGSRAFHAALGFDETEHVVFFRMPL